MGYIGSADLPSGPWQAAHTAALAGAVPWASAKGAVEAQTARARRRAAKSLRVGSLASRRASFARSRQGEHEHGVAALEVELRVAARRDRDVLLAADHVRDGGRVDAGAGLVLPELLAGLGVEGAEEAVAFAVEDQVARGREDAADQW